MELRSPQLRPSASARPSIACAQCGKPIIAPDWSEYLDQRRVRHLWACHACNYEFETLVCFAVPARAA